MYVNIKIIGNLLLINVKVLPVKNFDNFVHLSKDEHYKCLAESLKLKIQEYSYVKNYNYFNF